MAGGPTWGSRGAGGSVWADDDAPATAPGGDGGERYVDAQLVGTGGMGRVEAVRDTQLARVVARKELRAELRDEPVARARFEREVRITARLDHPGIVPVFDAGRGPDGTPWYTMRLVRGTSLEDALTGRDAAGRLALLPRVHAACEAVAAAHALAVVHRDLKPANVMLGPYGETQVVDWGLARELDVHDDASHAATGAVVGTPGWMSPEQAAGAPADRRSDVYALGRTLAAVLTGRCPPDDLPDSVPADLRAIVTRATAAAPTDRYPDAAALADDLAAWLAGRRVSAYAYPPSELAGRLVRAWRAPLAVAAVAAVLLAVAVGTGWSRAAGERDRALAAERELRARLLQDRVAEGGAAILAGDLGRAASAMAAAVELGDDPGVRGVLAALAAYGPTPRRTLHAPGPDCAVRALDPSGGSLVCATADSVALWVPGEARPRWEVPLSATDVARPSAGGPVLVASGGPSRVRALDPDTGVVLTTYDDAVGRGLLRSAPTAAGVDTARLWRAGEPDVTCDPDTTMYGAAFRDGTWLVPCVDGRFRLAGAREAVVQVALPADAAGPVSTALLADGTALVGTVEGVVLHVSLADGRVLGRADAPRGPVRLLVPSPDGTLVAVSGERMDPRLLTVPGMAWVAGLPDRTADLAWRDDRTLVTAGDALDVWTLEGDTRWGSVGGAAGLDGAALSDAGVVTLHDGGGTVTARALDGRVLATLRWQDGVVKQGEHVGDVFAAVGLFSAGVLRWDATTWTPLPTLGTGRLRHLAALDDRTFVAPRWIGGVLVTAHGEADRALLPDAQIAAVVAADGGAWVAVHDPRGISMFDRATLRWTQPDQEGRAALSRDASALWLAGATDLRRLDPRTGEALVRIAVEGTPTALAVDATGRWIAVGFVDGRVDVLDAEGALHASAVVHRERVSELRFTSHGLLSASWDGTARRWDTSVLDADLVTLRGVLAQR